jgi:hypothetical protein
VVESNGQDVQVPWFSGLCLEGEVAGQYEMDLSGSQQESEGRGVAGVLALDGLTPITIFVGANNSGKSRLMRELFGNSEAVKCLRMGPNSKELKLDIEELLKSIRLVEYFSPTDERGLREIIDALEALKADILHWTGNANNGWIGVNGVSLLDTLKARIDRYLRGGTERKASRFLDGGRFGGSHEEKVNKDRVSAGVRSSLEDWSRRYEDIRKSRFVGRMHDYLSLRRCYVPMLRGMRPPLVPVDSNRQTIDTSDCYEERSIIDYFTGFPSWRSLDNREEAKVESSQQKQAPDFSEKPRIFTGLSLYRDIQKRLLAPTHEERKSIRDYEMFLSANFFQGREVTLTPALHNQEGKDNDVVYIKIGESEDRPIYALGDGMQSLIICTYPIITELQRGSLFFLEEPDLCMHPSLQRIFLKVLRDYYINKGHQFFLTTHSNHLLDLLEDDNLVSIFSFSEFADLAPASAVSSQLDSGANAQSSKPDPCFRIRPSHLEDRQTLLELGVRPSATYLANATIWVEGVSDCAYLRAYMEGFIHYLKVRGNDWGKNSINGKSLAQRLEEYKEDRHYAFVEYSGANLTHFSFGDADCDEGQGQANPSIVTNVQYLCSKAIVIADGDITNSNKGNRWNRFVNQLDEHFIGLPCKEIENLIPDGLMRIQVQKDDSNIDETRLAEIKYADYRKLERGVGDYLSDLDFIKNLYKGKSGTLTAYRKKMWSSNDKGIPWLVRQAIERDIKRIKDGTGNPENTGNTQSNEEAVAIPVLPSYLTQDLIWLSVCLYTHIADCNHDTRTKEELKGFQEFIKRQGDGLQAPAVTQTGDSQPCPESDNTAESAALEWPIKDVNRSCLLTAFLSESNTFE